MLGNLLREIVPTLEEVQIHASRHEELGFLLQAKNLSKGELREVVSQVFRENPGGRLFLIVDSETQWVELEEKTSVDEHLRAAEYLFVTFPGRVRTVWAELMGFESYGAERAHLELVRLLLSEGILFRTFIPAQSLNLEEELKRSGSSVVKANYGKSLTNVVASRYWFQGSSAGVQVHFPEGERPDYLLAHSLVARILPAYKRDAPSIPMVWWLHEFGDLDHGFSFEPSRMEFMKEVEALGATLVANSSVVDEYLLRNLSRTHPPIGYLVDPPKSSAKELVTEGEFNVGVVGRLEPQKGPELAIHAFHKLRNSSRSYRLHFFGSGQPAYVARIKLLVRRLQLEECVVFHGFVRDQELIYQGLNAVVLASQQEAFGRVAIEAGLRGIPVVFHRRGAYGEILTPGVHGLEFEPDDPIELAKALEQLASSGESYRRLSAQSKNSWAEAQKPSEFLKRWRQVFDEASRGTRRS